MKGMHQEQHWAFNLDSDPFTSSHHFELPPTSTLAQISVGDLFEFDDESHTDLGFTSCSFLDNGVTRTDTFLDIDNFNATHVFGRNGLARADFSIRVSNCFTSYIVNFFFWDNVF